MRLLCLFAFTVVGFGQITHESIWLLKRVGSPSLSPDGKWALFSVVEPAYDEKDQSSDLWMVATDGLSAPRRLTSTKAAESGATWSADGKRIAFSARREGDDTAQIYVLELGGGEAQRLTSAKGGATSPKFSPDGKSILFVSTVKPDRPEPKYQARVYESFPIRYWDRWLDDSQARPFVQAVDGGQAVDLLAGTKLAAMPGFRGGFSDSGPTMNATWTPDSKGVVFAATVNANEAAFAEVIGHLFVVSATGGEPRQLTNSRTDSYGQPVFRPDGKALYAMHHKISEKAYSQDRIAMFAWPNPAERTIVSSGLDRSVSNYTFSADSGSIYLTADDAGLGKIYTIPANGGGSRVLFESDRGNYASIVSQGGVTVAAFDSATAPAEIVRIDAKGHTPLTHFNDEAVAKMALPPLRHFWLTSAKGRRIHSLVAVPPGFDESKKYPLFVMIHGGPHSNFKDQFFLRWNYHLIAQPGYVVLMPNYVGSTGFGEKFAQEIQGDPLKTPAEEINQAADEAIKRFPFIDGSRQCAGGASYGGHLSNWLQATTTRYKCLVSHAGLVNLEAQWGTSDGIYHREVNNGGPPWEQGPVWREQNPIRFAANFKTPVLVTVGERDFRVPLNNTLEYWSALQRMKVPSKLIVFPRANHWILNGEDSRFFYSELHGWLAKWLAP
jgi:dipeptidyl aminopeptidase/acylaminoacyl peptidase